MVVPWDSDPGAPSLEEDGELEPDRVDPCDRDRE